MLFFNAVMLVFVIVFVFAVTPLVVKFIVMAVLFVFFAALIMMMLVFTIFTHIVRDIYFNAASSFASFAIACNKSNHVDPTVAFSLALSA